MPAELDTSLTTHSEFQARVSQRRHPITRLLWHMVLREMNIIAANGGQGVRLMWRASRDSKPLELLSLDVDYPTLFIYQTWQYDTELFTRLVADAGFPHLCEDIAIGQNAVSFIGWSATEEKE